MHQAIHPLQPGSLHPHRCPGGDAGYDVERAADADDQGHAELLQVVGEEALLLRGRHGHQQDGRAGRGDLGHHPGLLFGSPVAVAIAGHHQPRVPPDLDLDDCRDDLFAGTQEEDLVAGGRGSRQQCLHEVDARDPFRHAVAEEAAGPQH